MFTIGTTAIPDSYVLDVGRITSIAMSVYEQMFPVVKDSEGNVIFNGPEFGMTGQLYHKNAMAFVQNVLNAADRYRLETYYSE